MALILCCAGKNTRFHDAGFDIPKYLLPWNKAHCVLAEILFNLKNSFDVGRVIILANKRDIYFYNHLMASLAILNIKDLVIEYIDDTDGQAQTAHIGTEFEMGDGPLFIHNADTILYNRKKTDIDLVDSSIFMNYHTFNAHVDCFSPADLSPKYCYVEVGADKVRRIVEKEVISDQASSGLYVFKNKSIYRNFYRETPKTPGKELYISDILKYMVKNNDNVSAVNYWDPKDTVVLGSPKEYQEEFAKRLRGE